MVWSLESDNKVLNLVINGLPSIRSKSVKENEVNKVLNLVINGLPSILPYYINSSTTISF